MNRAAFLEQLSAEPFDVCIIGGGATGAGCALDAALRGLKVCLIEKEDFAAQTSSKSTKLIHGGVRYLEQAVKQLSPDQFRMVRKALHERRTLLQNAPHLTRPLALLTPCHNWWEGLYYTIGLKMYDWLAGGRNIQPSRWLSKSKVIELIPQLQTQHLHSAVLYYDGQLDDARFALALIKSAAKEGAVVINHTKALEFGYSKSGKLRKMEVQDTLTGKNYSLTAKVFVNATGPFADHIRTMASSKAQPRMRVSRGSHIVLQKEHLPGNTAILVPKTDDGRVLFLIPWKEQVLVGTTDLEDQLNERPLPTEAEKQYLIDYVNRYLQKPITEVEVKAGFTGQRPLIEATFARETKSLVRDHEVEIDDKTKLISILGGKWTTYRLMASDTIDAVCEVLKIRNRDCVTEKYLLSGAENYTPDLFLKLQEEYQFTEEIARHLARTYGTEARNVADLTRENSALKELLVENHPFIRAEVVFARQQEMACTPEDILYRRLGLGLMDEKATQQTYAQVEKLLQA
ncbi:FAD-dependent oxidoreductase [Siphonobacter sp. SORGH_AS_0500]|uniref:glycerol-3-phosphate dehydrogenase/oxidase n=1 Tax=Siphonobacter sp. SORGH_AS_0500 TaxID=1864824 RepID=UPI00285A3B58|nr:FAD-dependent oxidoreductase [Siphonobacter sp. SORGH_AS_0500]MDR6193203.1 glycerol-3-phosphate dehydrogenase [Siphonobacter sp. SORGH_AS_0500]